MSNAFPKPRIKGGIFSPPRMSREPNPPPNSLLSGGRNMEREMRTVTMEVHNERSTRTD